MKNYFKLIVFQILSACISGLLISKMSTIGKVGISLFYKEYTVFKSFWQTALLFSVIQILFLLICHFISIYPKYRNSIAIVIVMLVLLCLGATVYDFQTETSHRLLKGYFHAGFYLFWISTLVTVFWVLLLKNLQKE